MNSRFGFWLRRLGTKFLVFTRALPFGNGRSLQTQKFGPPSCQNPNLEFISVYAKKWESKYLLRCRSWIG
jgi:hypothetical protein